jgi:hypothetical protein
MQLEIDDELAVALLFTATSCKMSLSSSWKRALSLAVHWLERGQWDRGARERVWSRQLAKY